MLSSPERILSHHNPTPAHRRSIPPRRANAPALRPAYRRTPSQVRPFQRAAERKRKYFILSRRCFHSPVRGSLRYTARTVPGAPPSGNTSLRASYAPVGFRLPLIRPRFSSVHRANRSRRAAEQERKSPRFIRSRRFPASTHPSAVLFGTPREPFPARRRAGTQVSALHTLPSVSGFHSSVRGSLRYTARTVPGAPPNRNASLRASYAPVGFQLPLARPRLPSVHRANRSRRAAE